MKKSSYNLEVEQNGFHLLYNQLKSTLTVLNDEVYFRYLSEELTDGEKQHLAERGVLVEDNFDELDFYLCQREKFREADSKGSVIFRLILTTFCNAKCFYCYENGMKKQRMSSDVVNTVIERIKQEAIGKKKLIVEWFGGEPLLEYRTITKISDELINYCDGNGIQYNAKIITNGLLFKEQYIRDALPKWRIKDAQITLDGLKSTYEKIKNYACENAFEIVIDNIKFLASNCVRVNIRLNYDDENLQEVLCLIDYLGEEFSTNPRINVYTYRIFNDNNMATECNSLDETADILLQRLYEAKLIRADFVTFPIRMGCQANRMNGGTITPNGDIYNCSMSITNGNYKVGSIYSAESRSKHNEWSALDLEEKCLKCKYLPICGGGCTLSKLNNQYHCLVNAKSVEMHLRLILNEFILKKEV